LVLGAMVHTQSGAVGNDMPTSHTGRYLLFQGTLPRAVRDCRWKRCTRCGFEAKGNGPYSPTCL
jgi:hypothetical protein